MNALEFVKYNKLQVLWESLANFVRNTCAERDESHGYTHMEHVALNSVIILLGEHNNVCSEIDQNVLSKVIIVAWLHDVADHKYDKDGALNTLVNDFLMNLLNDEFECKLIMKIIDMISFSKENNALKAGKEIDFIKMLGITGAYVRNIVSDADKLDALGKGGLERCIKYSIFAYEQKHNIPIPINQLYNEVMHHADDKLLRLKDEFIRTNTGKLIAVKLHSELLEEINKISKRN